MKIVIDISENDYWSACNHPEVFVGDYARTIKNGTPLPKGHGRLINADELLKAMDTWDKYGVDANANIVPVKDCYVPYVHYEDMVKSVNDAPTIIEGETE